METNVSVEQIHQALPAPSPVQNELYRKELEGYDFLVDGPVAAEQKIKFAYHVRMLTAIDKLTMQREKFANKIYLLVAVWLICVLVVLLLNGFGCFRWFRLDTNVLLALIGGTTFNVIGIFAIVAKYLFPSGGKVLPDFSSIGHFPGTPDSVASNNRGAGGRRPKGSDGKSSPPSVGNDPVTP